MYLIYFITFGYPNYNDLYKLTYTEPIPGIAKRARWWLLGHILRQPIGPPGNQAMMAYLTAEETTRHRKGAPQSCLVITLQRDCKLTAVALKTNRHLETLGDFAAVRTRWDNICSAITWTYGLSYVFGRCLCLLLYQCLQASEALIVSVLFWTQCMQHYYLHITMFLFLFTFFHSIHFSLHCREFPLGTDTRIITIMSIKYGKKMWKTTNSL